MTAKTIRNILVIPHENRPKDFNLCNGDCPFVPTANKYTKPEKKGDAAIRNVQPGWLTVKSPHANASTTPINSGDIIDMKTTVANRSSFRASFLRFFFCSANILCCCIDRDAICCFCILLFSLRSLLEVVILSLTDEKIALKIARTINKTVTEHEKDTIPQKALCIVVPVIIDTSMMIPMIVQTSIIAFLLLTYALYILSFKQKNSTWFIETSGWFRLIHPELASTFDFKTLPFML